MQTVVGNRSSLGFAIGEADPGQPDLRIVDVWIADRLVTHRKHTAYLPQFINSIRNEAVRLRRGEVPGPADDLSSSIEKQFEQLQRLDTERVEAHWFLQWGPTTDECRALIFGLPSTFRVAFRLQGAGDDAVRWVEIAAADLVSTLEVAAELLDEETPEVI